jgi:hypothetical protein
MSPMSNTRRAKPGSGVVSGRAVHQIKVTLRGSRPPIWRRLEVPSGITLRQLHDVIQAAFGWQDYHMWVFDTALGRYGIADRDLGHRSAGTKKLADVAPVAGGRVGYTYDFGDNWEHDILVEAVTDRQPEVAYPRCVAGRRAGPPEDCGGIWGYGYLVEILADPAHEDHAERRDWLGLDSAEQFDPDAFDVADVNTALSGIARVMVRH